jgi:hypothetical protein
MKKLKVGMICKYKNIKTLFPTEVRRKKVLKVKIVEFNVDDITIQFLHYPEIGHGTRDQPDGDDYKGYWFVQKDDLEYLGPSCLMDLEVK